MTFCLIGYFVVRCIKKARGKAVFAVTRELFVLLVIPAVCNLVVSFVLNFGVLHLSNSTSRGFSSTLVVFTALFSILFRKRRLVLAEIIGLSIVVSAAVVLCVLSFFGNDGVTTSRSFTTNSHWVWLVFVSIVLILVAQALLSIRFVVEEKVLHDLKAPKLLVVGVEGLYSLLLFCFVVMPVIYRQQSDYDPRRLLYYYLYFLTSTFVIPLALAAYIILEIICIIFGFRVIQASSALARSMVDLLFILSE